MSFPFAIAAKSYTVSEVNEQFPNDNAGEGIPILAAYGAMQDWDAIMWYTFEPKQDPAWKPFVGDPFDISLDPVRLPELAAGALLFLRADVEKAKLLTGPIRHSRCGDSMLPRSTERPYFTPGFPLWLPLEHSEVRISSFDGLCDAERWRRRGAGSHSLRYRPTDVVSLCARNGLGGGGFTEDRGVDWIPSVVGGGRQQS